MTFPVTEQELKLFVEQRVLATYPPLINRQFRAPSVLTADIPVAGEPGDIIHVPDAAAGARFQGYVVGTGWVNLG